MPSPSVPNDEAGQPRGLRASVPLDAAAQECVDRITRLAARALGIQAASFSLSGRDGQRFGSPSGITGSQDTRDLRPCAAVPVHGTDGTEAGHLCVFDVHDRHLDESERAMLADFAVLLERELAANDLRHALSRHLDHETATRELLDHMPEGVMMLDADGVILACNAVAETMYGAETNGLIGRNSSDLAGEDPARLRESLQAGKTDQLQAIARRVDGSVFAAEFSMKVLQASGAYHYSLFVRDISARKAAEQKAHIADARRRKYFVTATHELRTPMASVLGFSELLLQHDFEPKERADIVKVVHRQATRLVKLINEMLDLARIESGNRKEFDIRPHDAALVLAQTLTGLEGLQASHRIFTRLAPDLPPVLADSAKLQQALTNLIGNAIKYSHSDSDIRIDVFRTDDETRPMLGFRVIDKGIGMTAGQKSRIFEPFYRVHNDPDTTGTGLGMTIFREIVALHGGLVTIESSLGVGTEVVLLLPAATGASPSLPADGP